MELNLLDDKLSLSGDSEVESILKGYGIRIEGKYIFTKDVIRALGMLGEEIKFLREQVNKSHIDAILKEYHLYEFIDSQHLPVGNFSEEIRNMASEVDKLRTEILFLKNKNSPLRIRKGNESDEN